MQILVAGGLGSVGSNIASTLIVGDNKVTIVDPDLFSFPEQITECEVLNKYFEDTSPALIEQADKIVIACYDYAMCQFFNSIRFNKIKNLIELYAKKIVLISSWETIVNPVSNLSQLEKITINGGGKVLVLGDVVGASGPRTRYDTFVHKCILDMMLSGEYVLGDSGFRWIPITVINSIPVYLSHILSTGENRLYAFDINYRAIELVIAIRGMLAAKYKDMASSFNLSWSECSDVMLNSYAPTGKMSSDFTFLHSAVSSVILQVENQRELYNLLDLRFHPTEFYERMAEFERIINEHGYCFIG